LHLQATSGDYPRGTSRVRSRDPWPHDRA